MEEKNAQPQSSFFSGEAKPNSLLLIIGCLIGAILILLVILIFILYNQGGKQPEVPPIPSPLPQEPINPPSQKEKPAEEETGKKVEIEKRRIAYLDNNNIWLMDETGKSKRQITQDGGKKISYRTLAFKDRNNLSYVKCPDLNRCNQIYTHNLETDITNLETEVSAEDFFHVHALAWSRTGEKLAYLYSDPNQNSNLLYAKEGDLKRKIKEIEVVLGGRGGSFEDADYLQFSPEGKKLLLVYTSNLPLDEPSIFVFDTLTGGELFNLGTVDNRWSTHPFFIDNNNLGYKQGDKIIKRNLTTGAEEILVTAPNNLNPTLSPEGNFIAFWTYTEEGSADLYLFDLADSYSKIAEDMSYPRWLSNNSLVGYETKECLDCMFNYEASGLTRYDRDTDTKTSLLDSTTIFGFEVSP